MPKKPIQRTPEESAQIKRIVQVWYLNDREYPVGTKTGLKKLARQLRVDGKYLHMLIRRFKGDLDHAPKVLEPISKPESSYAQIAATVLAGHPLPASSSNLAPTSPSLLDPMHRSYDRDCRCDSCIRSRREVPYLEDIHKTLDGKPLYSDAELVAYSGPVKWTRQTKRYRRGCDIFSYSNVI